MAASRQDSSLFWSDTGLSEDISDLSEAIGEGSVGGHRRRFVGPRHHGPGRGRRRLPGLTPWPRPSAGWPAESRSTSRPCSTCSTSSPERRRRARRIPDLDHHPHPPEDQGRRRRLQRADSSTAGGGTGSPTTARPRHRSHPRTRGPAGSALPTSRRPDGKDPDTARPEDDESASSRSSDDDANARMSLRRGPSWMFRRARA